MLSDNISAGPTTGIIFGIFSVGSLVATIPSAYLPDKIGRRASMFVGNFILMYDHCSFLWVYPRLNNVLIIYRIGALVTATATRRSTFIGGRFLTGLGSGVITPRNP